MPRLGLRLTPHGHLLLDAAEDAPILDKAVAERLAEAFGRSQRVAQRRKRQSEFIPI